MAALKFRTPVDAPRPDADTTPPPPGGDAYSATTKEIHLTESLVAQLMEAQERAERRAEERGKYTRRASGVVRTADLARTLRRPTRSDAETLDRDNPFVTPTPMAPWETMPIPPPAEIEARAPVVPPAPVAPRRASGIALELVVVVWTLLIASVTVAHHFLR
jgi:hypothetical protein